MIYDTRFGPFGSFAPGHTPFIRRSFGNQLLQVGGGQGHFLHPLRGDITRRGSFADSVPIERRRISPEGIQWLADHGASSQLLRASGATTASRRRGRTRGSSRR